MAGLRLSVTRASGVSVTGRILAAISALLLFAGMAGCVVALTGVELSAPAVGAGLAGAAVAAVLGFFVAGHERLELRAYAAAAAAVVLVGIVAGFAGSGLVEGGAQFANALLVRIGERTQDYALPYRAGGEGALVMFCALAGMAGGLVSSLFAQRGMAAPVVAIGAAAAAGVISGWIPVGWWALLLALGIVMCLCGRSVIVSDATARSSYAWTLACALAVCALVAGGVGAVTQGAPVDTSGPNGAINRALWNMEYGDAVFAMPDGKLAGATALKASDQAALDVSVDAPTYEYLRGFVGARYEGDSWEPLGSDEVMNNRGLLYWLDKDGLVGSSQLSTASQFADLEEAGEVQLQLTPRSVWKPYAYLPYGYAQGAAAHATTDMSEMHAEGSAVQTVMFDPGITRKAYLLQDAIDSEQAKADKKAGADSAKTDAPERDASFRTYLDDNAAYRTFVEANCIDVPDEVSELFTGLYGPAVKLTTEQAKIQVLALLDDTVAYSEDPHALDEGEGANDTVDSGASPSSANAAQGNSDGVQDARGARLQDFEGGFVEQFLMGTRAGYSVHYATAATLLMRYYGVPARYVEGYVLNTEALDEAAAEAAQSDESGNGEDDGSAESVPAASSSASGESDAVPFLGSYTLTEKQAHAWVEYYLDGVGWVPFDVTPGWRNAGFYETTDDAQLVDDSQNWSVGEADQSTVWTPPEAEQQEAEEEVEGAAPIFGELQFILVLWPWVLAGFLLTLYLAFFVRGEILHAKLKRFLAQASDEKVAPDDAVPALFSYLIMLVQKCGGAPLSNAPYSAQGAALEEAGLCSAELFEQVARANDRILFSSADDAPHATREDALAVLECVKSVRTGLKKQVKPLRRFWQRDVRCLW